MFNAGTEKESTEIVKVPKGMIAGITSASSNKKELEVYADADLTELYTSTDYDSDTTIYIKWIG